MAKPFQGKENAVNTFAGSKSIYRNEIVDYQQLRTFPLGNKTGILPHGASPAHAIETIPLLNDSHSIIEYERNLKFLFHEVAWWIKYLQEIKAGQEEIDELKIELEYILEALRKSHIILKKEYEDFDTIANELLVR